MLIDDLRNHPKVCPTYNRAVKRLMRIVKSSKSFEVKMKYFEDFMDRFTTTWRVWNAWEDLQQKHSFPDEDVLPDNELKRLIHHNHKSMKKLPEIQKCYEETCKIEDMFDAGKISEWITELAKTEDDESIANNIMLVHDRSCRTDEERWEMWQFLVYFSRNCHSERFLEVLRRYCRYYVDDLEMRKTYRDEIETAEAKGFDTTKWRLDSIKLEFHFGSQKLAQNQLKEFVEQKKLDSTIISKKFNKCFKIVQEIVIPKLTKAPLKEKPKFSKNGIIQQNFAFRTSALTYICKLANYEISQKLQHSSKQLYLLTNRTLCFKFSISNTSKTITDKESLYISASNPEIEEIDNNIFIQNTLFVSCKTDKNILSKFMPKIQISNTRFLILFHQNLSLQEYNFLTNSKMIKRIALDNSAIMDNSKIPKEKASCEALMKNLPNAEYIVFFPCPSINPPTFLLLENMERNAKIKRFRLSSISDKAFSGRELCNFVRLHFAPNSKIDLLFENKPAFQHLLPYVKEIQDSWNPSSEKPNFEIRIGNDFDIKRDNYNGGPHSL